MKIIFISLLICFLGFSSFAQDFIEVINHQNYIQNDINFNYLNEIWLKSVDINEDDAYGFVRRASEKMDKGYSDEAYIDIEKAIKIDSLISYAYLLKGFYHLNKGSVQLAKHSLKKAFRLDSLNPIPLYYLGNVALIELDYNAASEYYKKSTKLDKDFYLGYFGLGNFYMSQQNSYKASKFYKKSISKKSGFYLGYYNLGLIKFNELNYSAATKYWNKALDANQQFSPANFMIGLVHIYNHKPDKAYENWSKAIEADPENPFYLLKRGVLYTIEENYDLAYNDIVEALAKDESNNLFSDFNKSFIDEERQKNIDQIIFFNKYENLFSDSVKTKLKEYLCLLFIKKYADAKKIINEVYKIESNNSIVNYFKGNISEQFLYYLQAFECYDKALKSKPFIYAPYLRMGILNEKNEDFQSAVEDLTDFISYNDSSIIAYRLRANSYMKLGELEKAIQDYNVYTQQDTSNFDVLFNKAVCHQSLNEYEKAIIEYTRALKCKGGDNETHYLRSECKYSLNDTIGALEDLNKLSLSYYNILPKAYLLRALIKSKLNKPNEAISDFTLFLVKARNNIEALEKRGKLYYNIGKFKEALNDYNKLIELEPELSNLFYVRGLIYVKLKLYSKACSDFKMARLKGYPVPMIAYDICNIEI